MEFAITKPKLNFPDLVQGAVLPSLEPDDKKKRFHRFPVILFALLGGLLLHGAASAAAALNIQIALLSMEEERHIPLSLLEPVIDDTGQMGAEQGIRDNNTTGQFTGQSFTLVATKIDSDASPLEAFVKLHEQGVRLFLVNLPADRLIEIADLPQAKESLLFNIAARDDELRTRLCRPNLLHTIPSRAMLADALAQYLTWKRWNEWFLVIGRHPQDKAYAEALKRAAKRFGHKIVETREWTFVPGARRTDSGHTREQEEVNAFTQVGDYDILIVADERDEFGEFLNYRSYLPRPVGGSHGLSPAAWSAVHEQWGATQFQRRFHEKNGRWMSDRDYSAWLAVRTIGEAATRTASDRAEQLKRYISSEDFNLAAFKGRPVTYRDWNGQLRQPLLLTSPRLMISVSPQKGFLHQHTTLDTLGFDRAESRCKKQQPG
ncbi:MAG: branched-chain amino acid ABC transporter substrate-binding protein [gamma proteobacterium symbiont of Ctena orbiculata]|nr:ABC transporter substrate-binding protein [Candidatus Thiodiazotropha taylori]MBT3058419.1 ABC transporter substrate-binding protein [Candidatus Thiodiazotropha sp. (ex Lucina pensylvanica)]MBT3061472.1 ABC transporter substrate-binding protein [Candidatus Thiodiazotropha sp. (ex Lucina pensylvanica)]PUB74755.1 MAG: branched-chain amino acid ABC transporter substrate-binding protein [gamma proteobacterium symbiont of Ctena orbiculata]PUB76961.1 MAG: branched-chain amino acid ABC transporter 